MYIVLILLMTFSGSLGAIFLKKGIEKIDSISIIKMTKICDFYFGGGFYLVGIITNVFLLKSLEYTVVYPLTSLTYVWSLLLSIFLLKEKLNLWKILGVAIILAGVFMICI